MRAALLLALALLAAGCTKEEPAVQQAAIAPGTLSGTVTDAALLPLAGAQVVVDGANLSATTDAAGSFSFELLPGEYVVLASHADFRDGALRASVMSAQTSTLAFQLTPIPRVVPYHEVQEAQGYIACAALVGQGEQRSTTDCGNNDPNDHPGVAFTMGTTDGLEAVVLELAWDARTDAAKSLRMDVTGRAGEETIALGSAEGTSPFSMQIPGRLLSGDTLTVTVSPGSGLTDEEAGLDAALVVQQPFGAYATLFYHEGAPGGYSALST